MHYLRQVTRTVINDILIFYDKVVIKDLCVHCINDGVTPHHRRLLRWYFELSTNFFVLWKWGFFFGSVCLLFLFLAIWLDISIARTPITIYPKSLAVFIFIYALSLTKFCGLAFDSWFPKEQPMCNVVFVSSWTIYIFKKSSNV